MELLSLATFTKVDSSYSKGTVHHRRGVVIFHSETERQHWLKAVSAYLVNEKLRSLVHLMPEEQLC